MTGNDIAAAELLALRELVRQAQERRIDESWQVLTHQVMGDYGPIPQQAAIARFSETKAGSEP